MEKAVTSHLASANKPCATFTVCDIVASERLLIDMVVVLSAKVRKVYVPVGVWSAFHVKLTVAVPPAANDSIFCSPIFTWFT
ncbi:hypothetical protein SDC9_138783 [bioreactor metagenome]|uniref:Uncharacterized protein n=1 Tax=bioreactor metagenome TaxID=1076179 RepID=A0A645DT78_9ZZZZ